jgi:acyl carrier protein
MTVKERLKKIIIEELNLEDIGPEDIEDDAPLFGEGLGLDSLDAVEIVVLVEKHFGVEVKMKAVKPSVPSIPSPPILKKGCQNEWFISCCHNGHELYMRSRKYCGGMHEYSFRGTKGPCATGTVSLNP